MLQVGDWVLYGTHGVCSVVGVEKHVLDRKRTEFLVLEPQSQAETRYYLPTSNPNAMAKLQAVLSREELTKLMASDEIHRNVWIPEENTRKQIYRDLINHGKRLELLQMMASVYRHKKEQVAQGRKFHLCDDTFLRDAEKLAASEISLVFGLPQEEAVAYLKVQLQ